MVQWSRFGIFAALLNIGSCASETGVKVGEMPVTDDAILAYATTPYRAVAAPRVLLGTHNDVPVVADFVCSDLCPAYTVRIVHYELPQGKSCTAAGGIEKSVVIAVSIASTDKAFCFPKVLARNWERYLAAAHIK